MYPQCPLPRHITALYVVAVASCVALFSHGVALVGADVLVYSVEAHDQPDMSFKDVPAKFGDPIPLEGIMGLVVLAQPDDTACKPLLPPPEAPNYFNKWIVLIRRYGCSFEEKIRNAQAANYSAAIVHNVNSSELEPMSAKNPQGIFIPSVFVGQQAGTLLKDHYVYENDYYILINDDLPFNINTHLLLPFAIVVGICFLIMVIFMVVKCIKDRRRQRRHRLPNSSLKKIPTAKFSKGDPYETCAICLEDYQEGEKLRILPCSHAYHSKCIDPWLTRNKRVCPVCKRKVFAQGEQVTETESDSDTDDTTPLVRPGSYGTQGGTFVPQRENPFQRAARQQQTSSGSVSTSTADNSDCTDTSSASSSCTDIENTLPALCPPKSTTIEIAAESTDEALVFNIASSGEHSINTTSESQEAMEIHVDATAVVVTPTVSSSRNSSPNGRKSDLVV